MDDLLCVFCGKPSKVLINRKPSCGGEICFNKQFDGGKYLTCVSCLGKSDGMILSKEGKDRFAFCSGCFDKGYYNKVLFYFVLGFDGIG